MRKRKPAPATSPQQRALEYFRQLGATAAATAAKPSPELEANALNRLYCRGWLAKGYSAGAWYATEAGLAELQRLEAAATAVAAQ